MTESIHEAVIVEAVRTPLGKRNGILAEWHPADLAAHTLRGLVDRALVDPEAIDDVVMGCVHQVGEQSLNIGRNAVLGAGFPFSVPATTVDRQCGSSQQALHFVAQGIMAGSYEVAIAAGVESLTRVPMISNALNGPGTPFGEMMRDRLDLGDTLIDQGIGAEMIAEKWNISRQEMDELSLASHQRAAAARAEGRFEREILPVPVSNGAVSVDQGIREDSSMETLGNLRPVFKEDGLITAGNACQIADGAAAMMLTSREQADRLGLRPRAVIRSLALAGDDPIMMLTAVIPATFAALKRAGLSMDDIDVFEINEAFASVVLAWQQETEADLAKVNPNGGSIALGHPVGCSGVRLAVTLLHELEQSGGRFGLQAMCEGGGLANAMVIERLSADGL